MIISVRGQSAALVKDDALIQNSDRSYIVEFDFDSSWDGFEKSAVFSAGSVLVTVPLEDDLCTIPEQCLQQGGIMLRVRVEGIQNENQISTDWCMASLIMYHAKIDVPKDDAIRSVELNGHTVKFYTTTDQSGTPAYTLDLPEVDISGKADKDNSALMGNCAAFDANGNPVDGGISLDSLLVGIAATDQEVEDMLDEVFPS